MDEKSNRPEYLTNDIEADDEELPEEVDPLAKYLDSELVRPEHREIAGHALKYEVYLAPHYNRSQVEGMKPAFARADIFIPESFGANVFTLEVMRKVADGRATPDEALNLFEQSPETLEYEFLAGELELLYRSNKAVAIMDIPDGDPLVAELYASGIRSAHPFDSSLETFPDVLKAARENLANDVTNQRQREANMLKRLKPAIQEALDAYPTLRNKTDLNVLLALGIDHTSLYHQMKKTGYPVSRQLVDAKWTSSLEQLLGRKLWFNKEVTDEELARIWLERIIVEHEDWFKLVLPKDANLPSLLERFNYQEIERLFELYYTDKEEFKAELKEELQQKFGLTND